MGTTQVLANRARQGQGERFQDAGPEGTGVGRVLPRSRVLKCVQLVFSVADFKELKEPLLTGLRG